MCRNPKNIIRYYFEQEFPNGDVDKLEKVMSKYSTEELERVADAVLRFGLAAILDVIEESGAIKS